MERDSTLPPRRERRERSTPHVVDGGAARDWRRISQVSRSGLLAACVLGLLAMLGVGTTVAAFTDASRLSLGTDGIGAEPYDLAVVTAEGLVSSANPADGVAVAIDGEETLAPGRTISMRLSVFNNSPSLNSTARLAVEPVGTGQVGTAPNISSYLRITVVDDATGGVLVGGSATDPRLGAPLSSASGSLGMLPARGSDALAVGQVWEEGAAPESRRDVTVMVHFLDSPGAENLNGGRSAMVARFTGMSA